MFRTVRMIATATITLWAATAAAEGPATPGKEPVPGTGEVTTGSATAGAPQPAPAQPPANPPAAPPAAVVPPAGAAAPGQPGTPATVLDTQEYEGVLGKGVRSSTGEDMGRIIDIILDKDGRPRAAIIDFGGFLGVGSRKIAVDWRAMRFSPDGKPSRLVLQLSRNQVRVSPEYKPGDPIVVLGPASPAVPAEGEQAAPLPPANAQPPAAAVQAPAAPIQAPAAPIQAPAAPVQGPVPPAPAPVTPAQVVAPATQPDKTPDKPAERSPER